ncbi:MAG: hypothetical protein HGB10_04675 [Coriobacteriia bacterium]|nr:hypothetical protein [Coriobacteriia bacterium]
MRFLDDDSGLTLTEFLIVAMLISVIITASYFMFNAAASMTDQTTARAYAQDEAQRAVDRMTRDLRQSMQDTSDNNGVVRIAEASQLKFSADVNADMKPEMIRYYIEGNSLKRTVALPTTSEVPYSYGSPGAPTILIKKLGTSAGTMFCYHSVDRNTTVYCGPIKHGFNVVTTTDPFNTTPKISMIGVKLDTVGESGSKTVTVTSRVMVRIRTVENRVD